MFYRKLRNKRSDLQAKGGIATLQFLETGIEEIESDDSLGVRVSP